MTRLPDVAHTTRPWRIHEVTDDFRLLDVWALPTPGGPDDFPRLVQLFSSSDLVRGGPWTVRLLFAVRLALGRLLRWDDAEVAPSGRLPTLWDRLPADLHDAPRGPDAPPFSSLYLLDDEWALELANRTVHGIVHLGWVPDGTRGHRGELAILVLPNGRLGVVYLAAIAPFRRLLVYPALLRHLRRRWREPDDGRPAPAGPAA